MAEVVYNKEHATKPREPLRRSSGNMGTEECKHCKKHFKSKAAASSHDNTCETTPVKNIKCDQCDQTFSIWGHLKYHKARKHADG